MNRNSHNLRGSTVNPAPRWRSVFIALILALVIGSVGESFPVQAAPATTEMRYSMSARKLNGNNATICVGDDVPIHVRVTRAEFVGNQGDNVQDIPGVRVEASMSNGGIGNLHPISTYTGYWNSDDPGGVDYKFHAEKVGTTIITFKGTINQVWWGAIIGLPLVTRRDFVESQVEITVEECQYKITAISHFSAQGVTFVATMEGALTKGADGRFTGLATVTWVGGRFVSYDCVSVFTIDPSQVELLGVQEGDELTVNVAYLPANLGNATNCPGAGSGNYPGKIIPDPITLTVSVSGGGDRQTQNLYEPTYYSMLGFVVVIIERVNQP